MTRRSNLAKEAPFLSRYPSKLKLLTPADVHYGQAEQVIASRTQVLEQAFMKHPNRFKYQMPQHPQLEREVWINKPDPDKAS